jgi:hypothetical protein
LAGGVGAGWVGAGELGFETGVEGLVVAAAAVAPLTVASGAIFEMTPAARPAFDKSLTDEYGRAAMIFFAVAGPTPGKLSNSFSLAVFKSTLALVAAEFVVLADESFEVLVFLLVWPAKMIEVITPHANTVANTRRKTPVRETLI